MNLRQLAIFTGVVEEGSFNRGAQRLNATQSGLSMQIRNLEERLGVQLLERSPQGVVPTREGQFFYRRAIEILRLVDSAAVDLRDMAESVGGPLRVGLMPSFTRGLLAPVLEKFLRDYPLVQVSVTEAYSAVLTDTIIAGGVDFAIVPRTTPPDALVTTFFGTDREVLVCRPGGTLPHLAPVQLSDCIPLKLVLPGAGNARRDTLERVIAQKGLPVTQIIDMDAMIATLEFVAVSDYATILPTTVCTKDLDGTERWLHPIIDPIMNVDYAVLEPAARSLPVAARLFLERLTDEYKLVQSRWQSVLDQSN